MAWRDGEISRKNGDITEGLEFSASHVKYIFFLNLGFLICKKDSSAVLTCLSPRLLSGLIMNSAVDTM